MKDGSSTNSSRPLRSLRSLYSRRTPWDVLFTTRALPSERLTHASKAMRSERSVSGSTSTRERGSLTHQLRTLLWQSTSSLKEINSLNRFMLVQVTVSIAIGHWVKLFRLRSGRPMPWGFERYVLRTTFKLMRFELAISRQFCALPEPTTEN